MRSMVHIEWQPIASLFLAKLTTFSGFVNGAGLTQARPMLAIFFSLACAVGQFKSFNHQDVRSEQNRPAIGPFSSFGRCDIPKSTKEDWKNGCIDIQTQDPAYHRRAKSYSSSPNRAYDDWAQLLHPW